MVPLKAATPCRPARQRGSGRPACFASLSAGRQTPDGGFVLQTTTLEFRDATEKVLASWPYSPARFVQDPNDPLRRILDTSFTPPSGLAGAAGLHLLFLATAQVTDPVSGQPETVEASAEAPVSVKPAVTPLLAVSFTGPATLEAGASGCLAIEITTSDPSQTTATFRILLADGTEVQSAAINLSGFQVAGNTMTGSYGFMASASPGLYLLVVSAARREGEPPGEPVETASTQSPLTVTPSPEPEPWLDITTPSPITAVEGSGVSVDFAVGPPSIRPLITGIKWKVLDGATLLFSGLVDPSSLREGEPPGEPPCLLGHFSFIVPKGIVSAPTDLTLQVVAEIAGNLVSDSIVLRVSPAPEEPIALSIYAVPEPPVFETETVEYRFLMTPPEIFPNLLGGTFALVERDTGNPLFVQNIDLSTVTVNSHITGAVSFEVPLGAASAGGGLLEFVLTFWTDEQTASAAVPLDVLPKPAVELVDPARPLLIEETEARVDFRLRPGEAVVQALSWEVRGASGTILIANGTVPPETLRRENVSHSRAEHAPWPLHQASVQVLGGCVTPQASLASFFACDGEEVPPPSPESITLATERAVARLLTYNPHLPRPLATPISANIDVFAIAQAVGKFMLGMFRSLQIHNQCSGRNTITYEMAKEKLEALPVPEDMPPGPKRENLSPLIKDLERAKDIARELVLTNRFFPAIRSALVLYATRIAAGEDRELANNEGVTEYLKALEAYDNAARSAFEKVGLVREPGIREEIATLEAAIELGEQSAEGLEGTRRTTIEDNLKRNSKELEEAQAALDALSTTREKLSGAEYRIPSDLRETLFELARRAQSDIDKQIQCRKPVDFSKLPPMPELSGRLWQSLMDYCGLVAANTDIFDEPEKAWERLRKMVGR